MPFIYGVSLATPGNYATNSTINTDTDHLRALTVATRPASVNAIYLLGKGAGLTAISGIIIRVARFSTPSTVGTAAQIRPRDPAAPAATTTWFTAPTVGTTQIQQLVVGCGAAGPGGWVAPTADSQIYLEANGGADGNLDLISQSGTISLNFEMSVDYFD